MIRALGGVCVALLGGWAWPAAGAQTTTLPQAEATRHLVRTFSERCLARPAKRSAFLVAGQDLDRSPEMMAAMERLQAKRASAGRIHDSGGLAKPFPVWILVGTGRFPGRPEMGSCELVWSGSFPEDLKAALEQRLGRASNPPDPYGGATVHAFPPRRGAPGLVLLSNKPPLHSIVLLIPLG